MLNTEVLNGLKSLMINHANENQINLRAEFGTPEKFNNFIVNFAINQLVELGMPIEKAFDAILGAGEYDKLCSQVYNICEAERLASHTTAN